MSLPRMSKLPNTPKVKNKMKKTMGEFKTGALHSGSKTGPLVKKRAQAIAIAIQQARTKAM